jgi:hypothetical protein
VFHQQTLPGKGGRGKGGGGEVGEGREGGGREGREGGWYSLYHEMKFPHHKPLVCVCGRESIGPCGVYVYVCVHRLVFDREPAPSPRVEVVATQYQPINTSLNTGIEVVTPLTPGGGRGGRGGRISGTPSLVWALTKTFGPEFVVSIFFKIISDLLAFANPLILK